MPAIIPEQGYGLLDEMLLDPRDWRVGSISGATRVDLNVGGDFTQYLPVDELQIGVYFDTLACVSFSALNAVEVVLNVLLQTGKLPDEGIQYLIDQGLIVKKP